MPVTEDKWPITRQQLRAGRLMAGLKVRELAKMASVTAAAISSIETGKTANPQARTVENLRLALQSCGVEFTAGGWVRHSEDAEHGRDVQDARERTIAEHAFWLACLLVRVLEPDHAGVGASNPPTGENSEGEPHSPG